jgi:hypothetical protein
MAVIVGPQNQTPELIQHSVDSFLANQKASEQNKIQQQQVNQEGQASGALTALNAAKFDQAKREMEQKGLDAFAKEVLPQIQAAHNRMQAPGVSDADKAQTQARLDAQIKSYTPEQQKALQIYTVAPFVDNARQSSLNSDKFAADQTGIAAAGGTDPNAVNMATKIGPAQAFMPKEGFAQQQAVDLGRRSQGIPSTAPAEAAQTPTAPNLTAAIPKPVNDAVSNYEARATEAMPTGAQNQVAQTGIEETKIASAGSAELRGAQTKDVLSQSKYRDAQTKALSGAGTLGAGATDQSDPIKAILSDPTGQSFHNIKTTSPDGKMIASQAQRALLARYGRMPGKLGQLETNQLAAAYAIPPLLAVEKAIKDKWDERHVDIVSVGGGSFDQFSTQHMGGLGVGATVKPEWKQEFQKDVQIMNGLALLGSTQETRATTGRYVQKAEENIHANYPNAGMTAGKFQGTLVDTGARADQIKNALLNRVWGQKIPPAFQRIGAIDEHTSSVIQAIVDNDPEIAKRLGYQAGGGQGANNPAGDTAAPAAGGADAFLKKHGY